MALAGPSSMVKVTDQGYRMTSTDMDAVGWLKSESETGKTSYSNVAIKRLPLSCARRCMDHSNSQFIGVLHLSGTFPPQNCPSPSGIVTSMKHTVRRAKPTHCPNSNSIGSAVSVWVPNARLYNALSMGKKTPKTAPSPWDFVTLLEEDRATARGNTHKNFGRDCACGSRDIIADRQTLRRAHHNTSQPLLQVK